MSERPLRVFIASHACATPLNQKLFALAAAERKWNVTLCVPDKWYDEYGTLLPARLMSGFDADLLPMPVVKNGSVPLHAYRGRLRKVLRETEPDVIYAHNEAYALSTMQWCWANQCTGRRPFGFFSCQNIPKTYPPPFRQGERWVYEKSSFFFPITATVEEAHRTKGYARASTIVPLGYDSTLFHAKLDIESRHRSSARRELRLAFVGRVVEEKGLRTLVSALGVLRMRDWKLLIAGSGPYESSVREASKANRIESKIEWLGFVPREEIPSLLESVDLLVLPSESRGNWKEQFGRILIEAMACGTPVVGSDSGEIPKLIRETGGGAIFPEGNVKELARTLSKLMDDHDYRADCAVHSASYVAQNYALPALASRFATAIEAAARQ